MKKIILTLALFFSLALFSTAHAFTVELVEENEETATYNLLASPPENSSGLQLRVQVQGGTINTLLPGTQKFLLFGMCSNGESFTENEICIDYGLIGDYKTIEVGDILLGVTVEKSPDATVEFLPQSDYGYLTSNNQIVNDKGEIVQDLTPETVTGTEVGEPIVFDEPVIEEESNSMTLYVLIGILVVLVIAFVVVMFASNKSEVVSVKRSNS